MLCSFLSILTPWLGYGVQYQAPKYCVIMYLSISSFAKIGTPLFWVVWRMKDVFSFWSSLNLVSVIGLMCIYLWLWGCFNKKSSFWQISHTKRLLNLGKVKTSGMVIHESWFFYVVVSFETWPNFQSFMNPFSFHDVKLIFLFCYNLQS